MQTKEALPSYRLESAPHGVAMSTKFVYALILSRGAEFCKGGRLGHALGAMVFYSRAFLPIGFLLRAGARAHLPKSRPMSRRCRLLVAHRGHGEDALPIVPPDRGETEKAAAGCPRRRRLRYASFVAARLNSIE